MALAAGGLRCASSSTNVIPPGVVGTAEVAVEGRVSVGGGAEAAGSAAVPAVSVPGKKKRKRRRRWLYKKKFSIFN